jgi:hypothetical protein
VFEVDRMAKALGRPPEDFVEGVDEVGKARGGPPEDAAEADTPGRRRRAGRSGASHAGRRGIFSLD